MVGANLLEYANAQRSVTPLGALTTTRKRGTVMAVKKSNRRQKTKEFHGGSFTPEYNVWRCMKKF